MPKGKGTYGNKVGRPKMTPAQKEKAGRTNPKKKKKM